MIKYLYYYNNNKIYFNDKWNYNLLSSKKSEVLEIQFSKLKLEL